MKAAKKRSKKNRQEESFVRFIITPSACLLLLYFFRREDHKTKQIQMFSLEFNLLEKLSISCSTEDWNWTNAQHTFCVLFFCCLGSCTKWIVSVYLKFPGKIATIDRSNWLEETVPQVDFKTLNNIGFRKTNNMFLQCITEQCPFGSSIRLGFFPCCRLSSRWRKGGRKKEWCGFL